MREFVSLLAEAYRLRDNGKIARLTEWLSEDCVTVGTSMGEMYRGAAGFSQLLADDFEGWVDLEIAPDFTLEEADEYRVYTLRAEGLYRFTVNEKCYERYAGYMRDIAGEPISGYAKAVKAIWELDHLIASKPGVRHIDRKRFSIRLLVKDDRICLVSFLHDKQKNHIDCYLGAQEDMDEDYAAERACYTADEALSARLLADTRIDGLRFCEAAVERHGDWFVGCGTLHNDTLIDEEIARDFLTLDEEETAYRRLYLLRRRLGETLRLYSLGDTQKIVTRFFGVLRSEEPILVKHAYPFYWILED